MGRRASIILPKRFRRGFRGATGGGTPPGGGGGAFTTLGPNAPSGLLSPFPDYLGDVFPGMSPTSGYLPNIYGMAAPWPDGRCWELVPDAESPSGSCLRQWFYGHDHPRVGVAWIPPAAGGAAPVRGPIRSGIYDATVPRKWGKMYVHMWQRFSANFSVAATLMQETTHATGFLTAGSTITTAVDSTKAWIPGEHVGRFLQHGASHGAVIIANDATSVTVDARDRAGYVSVGMAYTIFSWADATPPTTTTSAGCKGWFWPHQTARMVGPVPGRGDGAVLGVWNAPKDASARWGENHYQAGWYNFIAGGAGAPGGIWDGFQLQLSKKWESPWLEDANDLPVYSLTGRFDQWPDHTQIPYVAGTLRKAEYFLQMNTPGVRNGIFRVWIDGVLWRDHTDVLYCEQYVSALSVEGSGGVPRPIIGGASRDAAYEIIECYWNQLFTSTTFGGIASRYVPTNTMSMDILAMAVSGAP